MIRQGHNIFFIKPDMKNIKDACYVHEIAKNMREYQVTRYIRSQANLICNTSRQLLIRHGKSFCNPT